MLQNARVTAFTILTEKRTGECGKGVKSPPPPPHFTQIRVKIISFSILLPELF